jgi:hypothetical protein
MDSPNKFDWEEPGTTQTDIEKRRHGALKARHRQIMAAVDRWNQKASAAGYEGIDAALNSLGAMSRGPRPVHDSEKCLGGLSCPICSPNSGEVNAKV